jgi:hypothetical protein
MKRITLLLALPLGAGVAIADRGEERKVEHVLIISIDGMHQQDLAKCLAANTCPHIAALADHGVVYTNAYTPGLSDSVPGLAALVAGGSPRSTGLFYDDIYDRTLYAGTDPTCTGTQGVEVFLQELVGIDAFNGGRSFTSMAAEPSIRSRFRTAKSALTACRSIRTTSSRPTPSSRWSRSTSTTPTPPGPTSTPGEPIGSMVLPARAWMTSRAPKSTPSMVRPATTTPGRTMVSRPPT